jgi:hypothetical protein
MKLDFCAVCGSKEDLHLHHIDPVVHNGGRENRKKVKYDDNKPIKDCTPHEIFNALFDRGFISEHATITLCSWHHKIMHGIISFQKTNHSNLIKEGINKRREQGKKIGRPSKFNFSVQKKILEDRKLGLSIRKICRKYEIGVQTYYSYMNFYEEEVRKSKVGTAKLPITKPKINFKEYQKHLLNSKNDN